MYVFLSCFVSSQTSVSAESFLNSLCIPCVSKPHISGIFNGRSYTVISWVSYYSYLAHSCWPQRHSNACAPSVATGSFLGVWPLVLVLLRCGVCVPGRRCFILAFLSLRACQPWECQPLLPFPWVLCPAICTPGLHPFSFLFLKLINLAVSGLSCSTREESVASCQIFCWDGRILVVDHGLSCSLACGILVSWPGIKPASPTLQGRFLTTRPPGKSSFLIIRKRFRILWLQKWYVHGPILRFLFSLRPAFYIYSLHPQALKEVFHFPTCSEHGILSFLFFIHIMKYIFWGSPLVYNFGATW